jgi:cobalamin biosynthetic protein CobC
MIHGGRLRDAREAYGDPAPWLDLSTGINPHCWPGAQAVDVDWRALPDEQDLADLERIAADYFGVAAVHVCAVPGTEIALRLLDHLGLPGSPRHLEPSYRTHAQALSNSVAIAREDISTVAADGGTILLANPNNPDGHILPTDTLIETAQSLAASGGWLIVDEAFADTDPAMSVSARVNDQLPLLVLRSFGKFFGLAGVRLGFAIGPQPLIATLRGKLGSWPVSTAALRIGSAAYRDAEWIAAMRATLISEAAALDRMLEANGFRVMGDCPLFRLIEVEDADALFDRLARQAILTRPFDYDPRWLRFGLPGSADALDRLDRALSLG